MNKKFKNRYRNESIRLKNYDYSKEGLYFITICTKGRERFFGKIEKDEMILSDIGKIVSEEWENSESIRKHIYLDEWVIMPNHIHGIVGIDYGDDETIPGRDVLSKRPYEGEYKNMSKISPVPNSLSTMIRFFKRMVTVRSKELNSNFGWQPRFYDHIIRDTSSLNRIRKYIVFNPEMWNRDRNNLIN